jgi:hypothetical protein
MVGARGFWMPGALDRDSGRLLPVIRGSGMTAHDQRPKDRRRGPVSRSACWLARKDSNLRSPDPESGALPLGHSPVERGR